MPRTAVRQLHVRWLPYALILTSLANLLVALSVQDGGEAMRFHDDGSLTHIVRTDDYSNSSASGATDEDYGFYMELHDVAAGDSLIMPSSSWIDPELALDLSGVEVTVTAYETEELPTDLEPNGGPLGHLQAGTQEVPYWILPASKEETRWWLAIYRNGFVVIPESVAPSPEATHD